MMKIVIQDIFLKQILIIRKNYLYNLHKDLPFLPERKKVERVKKTYLRHRRQEKICYSHKTFKTSIKPWVKT